MVIVCIKKNNTKKNKIEWEIVFICRSLYDRMDKEGESCSRTEAIFIFKRKIHQKYLAVSRKSPAAAMAALYPWYLYVFVIFPRKIILVIIITFVKRSKYIKFIKKIVWNERFYSVGCTIILQLFYISTPLLMLNLFFGIIAAARTMFYYICKIQYTEYNIIIKCINR